MQYQQIVFDVDGTLIDTEYAVIRSLQDTIMDVMGKAVKEQDLTFALGITGRDALHRLGIEHEDDALDLWNRYMLKYSDTVCVFDTMRELLQTLKQMNYALGIVTSKTTEEFKAEFTRLGIGHYFSTVICADDTVQHKPHPAPLLTYMERTNCPAGQLLYIGDSVYDMECAKRAKANFALAQWGAKNRLQAQMCFQTPLDILKILEK